MSNKSISSPQVKKKDSDITLPDWTKPIMNVCGMLYPVLLAIGGLTLVLLVALVGIRRFDFPWIHHLFTLLGFCLSVGILAMLVAECLNPTAAWIGAVIGVLIFSVPIVVGILMASVGITEKYPHVKSIEQFVTTLHSLGALAIILSVTYLALYYVAQFILNDQSRGRVRLKYMPTQTKSGNEKPALIPKCWQMSRCRSSVRDNCPNFTGKIACWKKRSGCFCDHSLADFLMTSVGRGESDEIMEMQRLAARNGTAHATQEKKRRPWREQKRLCMACPIYNEHQEYKYKHFRWVSIAITVGIVAGAYKFFNMGYDFAVNSLETALEHNMRLSFLSVKTSLANSPFEYLLLGVLSLLLLSYVISIVDKYFLEWKL